MRGGCGQVSYGLQGAFRGNAKPGRFHGLSCLLKLRLSYSATPFVRGGCGEGHDQRHHDSADRLRCLGDCRSRVRPRVCRAKCEVVESTWRFPEAPWGASSALEVPGYRSKAQCCRAPFSAQERVTYEELQERSGAKIDIDRQPDRCLVPFQLTSVL